MPASRNTTTPVEPGYQTPAFPSLYWLVGPTNLVHPAYLYHHKDIWRFTFFWTLILLETSHLLVGFYAVIIVGCGGRNDLLKPEIGEKSHRPSSNAETRKRLGVVGGWQKLKVLWMVPVIYGVVAGVEAALAGSVVGLM